MSPETKKEVDGRRRRGLATRAKIAEAAKEAFLQHGFVGTTVAEIAKRAGVSEPTIYYAFGTKEEILAAALNSAIFGPGEPTPLPQQDWMQEMLAAPDPVEQLARAVEGAGEILRRAGGLVQVTRSAALAGNEALAALGTTRLQERLAFQEVCIAALVTKTPLRNGLTEARAVDIAALLMGPELYLTLTGDLGWTHDAWREWLLGCLVRELLPAVAATGSRRA